jgi:magnesium-dependent phosphatase 1
MIRRGQDLGFYREVPTILAELRKRKIHIAAASRTSAPELYVFSSHFILKHSVNERYMQGSANDSAREALGMLLIPDENGKIVKSIEYFNTVSTPFCPHPSTIPLSPTLLH